MFNRGVEMKGAAASTGRKPGSAALLSVSDLRMVVSGSTLLDIQRLHINAGGPTAVMGPNGAGKSLLLRLLHGLTDAPAGSILMHGQTLDDRARRRQAMVFQSPVILRRSVRANVEFALASHNVPRHQRKSTAMTFLEKAGLHHRARQQARSLSGGEKQKLAVIRALATEPEVLFLDEPTSQLDPSAVQSIEQLVLDASAAGTKIVLVTHDLGQAQRLAEEVLFLHKGRVIEQTPIEMFTSAPVSNEAIAYRSGALLI